MDFELKIVIFGTIFCILLYIDAFGLNLIPRSSAAAVLLLFWLRFRRLMERDGAAEVVDSP